MTFWLKVNVACKKHSCFIHTHSTLWNLILYRLSVFGAEFPTSPFDVSVPPLSHVTAPASTCRLRGNITHHSPISACIMFGIWMNLESRLDGETLSYTSVAVIEDFKHELSDRIKFLCFCFSSLKLIYICVNLHVCPEWQVHHWRLRDVWHADGLGGALQTQRHRGDLWKLGAPQTGEPSHEP